MRLRCILPNPSLFFIFLDFFFALWQGAPYESSGNPAFWWISLQNCCLGGGGLCGYILDFLFLFSLSLFAFLRSVPPTREAYSFFFEVFIFFWFACPVSVGSLFFFSLFFFVFFSMNLIQFSCWSAHCFFMKDVKSSHFICDFFFFAIRSQSKAYSASSTSR